MSEVRIVPKGHDAGRGTGFWQKGLRPELRSLLDCIPGPGPNSVTAESMDKDDTENRLEQASQKGIYRLDILHFSCLFRIVKDIS
jgi:hypothetical protein